MQHRGGPAGFLKVLDDRTLAFADYAGNRQYITVGNLSGNDRVMLFLIDYERGRRLKSGVDTDSERIPRPPPFYFSSPYMR